MFLALRPCECTESPPSVGAINWHVRSNGAVIAQKHRMGAGLVDSQVFGSIRMGVTGSTQQKGAGRAVSIGQGGGIGTIGSDGGPGIPAPGLGSGGGGLSPRIPT